MNKQEKIVGLAPVYNAESELLILGSFPSVKSRDVQFYYGNKQNRFWKMLCGYFNEQVPQTVEGKREFLLRHKIALWDMVIACDIQGSADASIQNAEIADLNSILKNANIKAVFLNGALAYDLFVGNYADCGILYRKLPSTSPANPRYDETVWVKALDGVFAPPESI